MKEPETRGRPPKQFVTYPIEVIVDNLGAGSRALSLSCGADAGIAIPGSEKSGVKLFSKEQGNCWVVAHRYSEFHTLDKIIKVGGCKCNALSYFIIGVLGVLSKGGGCQALSFCQHTPDRAVFRNFILTTCLCLARSRLASLIKSTLMGGSKL